MHSHCNQQKIDQSFPEVPKPANNQTEKENSKFDFSQTELTLPNMTLGECSITSETLTLSHLIPGSAFAPRVKAIPPKLSRIDEVKESLEPSKEDKTCSETLEQISLNPCEVEADTASETLQSVPIPQERTNLTDSIMPPPISTQVKKSRPASFVKQKDTFLGSSVSCNNLSACNDVTLQDNLTFRDDTVSSPHFVTLVGDQTDASIQQSEIIEGFASSTPAMGSHLQKPFKFNHSHMDERSKRFVTINN